MTTGLPYKDAADGAGDPVPNAGRGAIGGGGGFAENELVLPAELFALGVGPLRNVLISGLPIGV